MKAMSIQNENTLFHFYFPTSLFSHHSLASSHELKILSIYALTPGIAKYD